MTPRILAALIVVSLFATPSSEPKQPHTAAAADGPSALSGAPQYVSGPVESYPADRASVPLGGAPLAGGPLGASSYDTSAPATANRRLTSQQLAVAGIWSYADPSHGPRYLAIPEGRGWRVTVCGPLACLERVSTDAGPDLFLQRKGRIGDLSSVDFLAVCGPLSRGLCDGSYMIQGRALPETSTGGER
jgi:hypothetical protein